jgi:hypothetical protein
MILKKSYLNISTDLAESIVRHQDRGFLDLPWNKKVGLMADSFYYIEEGVGLMNRPSDVHSFTPEKVKEEAERLLAKTYLLINALEKEISESTAKS